MATRLYLPSSGTSPLESLAIAAEWEGAVSTFFRAPLVSTKSNTALTSYAARFLSTATQENCWGQWVSAPLSAGYNFTSADELDLVVACKEGHGAVDAYIYMQVRVVSGDGSTVRGTVWKGSGTVPTAEFSTAALVSRMLQNATGASVSAQAGDRLVVEVGAQGVSPSTGYDAIMRFGDPTAVSDFEAEGTSDDLCPWVELSPTLAFQGGATGYMTTMRGIW